MGYRVSRAPILGGSNLDGRRRAARRVKEVIRQFTAAVGGKPTPGQIVLIRIIGELTAITEAMRTSMLAGGIVDSNDAVRMHNTLLRSIEKLKLPSDIQADEDLGSLMQRMAEPKDSDEPDDIDDDQVDEPPAD